MGTARVFQLAEVFLECEGQRNRADSRYGHGDRRHDSPPRRAIAEENGRGWSLTKSTFSEECGRSVRRRPCIVRSAGDATTGDSKPIRTAGFSSCCPCPQETP